MKKWTPRTYQTAMREFVLRMFAEGAHGVNLFAGVGVGKTSAALSIADAMLVCGYARRVLVIAPKRVCTDAWPPELTGWIDFSHLRYTVAVGGKDARLAAIHGTAPVVIVNYDVLPAFVMECGDKWNFDLVIADESSRLKSHRVTIQTSKTGKEFARAAGGKQASSIAKITHSRVKHWLNLTASPAPNGLIDLWAQVWYCDAGKRLGRSFTAFKERWFQSVPRGERLELEPLDFAQDQIQAAIRDICLTVEASDYFDLPPLVESVVHVELPSKALAIYKDFERKMFAEIEGIGVEAFNAAAMTMKCLAGATLVLTDRGWVQVRFVRATDLLWDGIEWVAHDGLLHQGYRDVIECWGVDMTPDHRVMTKDGWRTAQEVIDGKSSEGHDRYDVRLPDDHRAYCIEACEDRGDSTGDVVGALRLWQGSRGGRDLPSQRSKTCVEVMRVQTRGRTGQVTKVTRHDRASLDPHMERDAPTVSQPRFKGLSKLRSAWNYCLRPLVTFVRGFLLGHAQYVAERIVTRTHRQQQGVLTGELPMGDTQGTRAKYTGESHHRHTYRPDGRGASSGTIQSLKRGALSEGSEGTDGFGTVRTATYDIKNAGPRFRFTVLGRNGEIFLSHNCRQIANGAVYYDDERNWQPVHDAKLDALRECVLDANGMPVLVAYQFQTDVERIKKAFPKAVHINDDPKAVEKFNAGLIPMLLGHPAGMGHGISLQHGSNYMVDYATGFNLEHDEQVIGRIGPTRQAQSGYNRSVYRRRLIAKGTIEEYCLKRIKTKDSIQQMLRDAMKGERCD